jgi:linoleoyl-CoA desaturase
LAIVFQLAHVVENTEFELALTDTTIESEWAAHQVRTTANFARGSKLVSWCVGGLNYQVEHHLFPRMSHVHYPAISEIVKANCEKYNLPYNEYPTFGEAVMSHIRTMRKLGEKPQLAVA